MKAVVLTGNRQLEVREVPKPVAGRGQVVIKMKVAAICGSDLHHYRRVPRPGEIEYVSGHEPCGIIDSVGEGVTHVVPGQRVALYHYEGCGYCKYCAAGLFHHCAERKGFGSVGIAGSDADYMVCNGVNAIPLPDELTYIDGSFIACIAATSYSALIRLNINSRTNLCIYGLGPVGLTALLLAKAMRPDQIICVDPNPIRRKMGLDNGADIVLDSDDNTVQEIIKLTGGGADCSLETSGSAAAQKNILNSAGHFGRVAVVGFMGLYEKDGNVSLSQLIPRELTVFGSSVISLPDTHNLIDFMVKNDVHFDPLVTHRFPLSKAKEAFEACDSLNTGKVMFEFD